MESSFAYLTETRPQGYNRMKGGPTFVADEVAGFGIRFTGSTFQGHLFISFRFMPENVKKIEKLFAKCPFKGIAGMPPGTDISKKTTFTFPNNEWAVEKKEIGTLNLDSKRYFDVHDCRTLGLLLYIARHVEMLRNGKVDRLLYLLLEFVPHSASYWKKKLKKWGHLESDNDEFEKARLDFYSRWLEDVSVCIYLFLHFNVNVLYDTENGVPQMEYNTEELLKQKLKLNMCYNGKMQHYYGDKKHRKYVTHCHVQCDIWHMQLCNVK